MFVTGMKLAASTAHGMVPLDGICEAALVFPIISANIMSTQSDLFHRTKHANARRLRLRRGLQGRLRSWVKSFFKTRRRQSL